MNILKYYMLYKVKKIFQITDVPGLSDTHHPEEIILKETAKSVTMVAPGPHVIIFVFSSRERYTQVCPRIRISS